MHICWLAWTSSCALLSNTSLISPLPSPKEISHHRPQNITCQNAAAKNIKAWHHIRKKIQSILPPFFLSTRNSNPTQPKKYHLTELSLSLFLYLISRTSYYIILYHIISCHVNIRKAVGSKKYSTVHKEPLPSLHYNAHLTLPLTHTQENLTHIKNHLSIITPCL